MLIGYCRVVKITDLSVASFKSSASIASAFVHARNNTNNSDLSISSSKSIRLLLTPIYELLQEI